MNKPIDEKPEDSYQRALRLARHRERLSEAAWRQKRAEVARLVAAGEEAAARRLLRSVGIELPAAEHAAESAAAQTPSNPKPTSQGAAPSGRDTSGAVARAAPKNKTTRPVVRDRRHKNIERSSPRCPPSKPKHIKPTGQRRIKRKRGVLIDLGAWLGERPSWALSLAAHVVLMFILMLATFATLQEQPLFLTAAIGEEDAWSEMPIEATLVELETDAPLDSIVEPIDSLMEESLSLEPERLELTAFEVDPVIPSGDLLGAELAMATAEAAGDGPGAAEDQAGRSPAPTSVSPQGKPGKVRFFGSESFAERVAFVVDNSGSMQRGRMETTLMELDRAVASLHPSQSFYVVFFSDQAYPMFFPEPVEHMLSATRENKRRLSRWLGTVQMCLGGRLLDAVELAAEHEPQVVYLLSDGDIRSPRIMGGLTNGEAWDFAIHTLGMGARNEQHARNLAAIAQANEGTFKLVQAHPAAVQRALTRPIVYNRQPGKVWGSRVQQW